LSIVLFSIAQLLCFFAAGEKAAPCGLRTSRRSRSSPKGLCPYGASSALGGRAVTRKRGDNLPAPLLVLA